MATSNGETENKMVTLKASDGHNFEVEESAALQSETIKNLIEDIGTDTAIPLQNVTGPILGKVIEYCREHVKAGAASEMDKYASSSSSSSEDGPLKKWDADFVKVDDDTLFDLILAANYLNIKGLLDLTCQTVANKMVGKTPEQIREIFHIKNDYTPEEEEEVRKENQWAFE